MNEEALQYSYNLFTKDGYNGTIEDYTQLLMSDSEAVDYSYNLFSTDGYTGDLNQFSELIWLKKKKVLDCHRRLVLWSNQNLLRKIAKLLKSLKLTHWKWQVVSPEYQCLLLKTQ